MDLRPYQQEALDATLPMAKQLMKFWFNPDIPFEVASKQMDMLASVGWHPTLAQLDAIRKLAA